jgi:hypothetical protein
MPIRQSSATASRPSYGINKDQRPTNKVYAIGTNFSATGIQLSDHQIRRPSISVYKILKGATYRSTLKRLDISRILGLIYTRKSLLRLGLISTPILAMWLPHVLRVSIAC